MNSTFQPKNLDYSSMFSTSPSLDPSAWNLSSDFPDSTSTTVPNTTDLPPTSTTTTLNHTTHCRSNNTSPVSVRNIFDPSLLGIVATPDHIDSTLPKPTSTRTSNNKNSKPTPQEDAMIQRIHTTVGGPAKLSTYDEPASVRRVVIEALANEQKSHSDACRIRRGHLSVTERRVVRTVTNRGAAVRSRMRQRKEMASLRMQVRARDGRVKQLEAVVRDFCSTYAVLLPPSVIPNRRGGQENISVPPSTNVEPHIQQHLQQQQQSHYFDGIQQQGGASGTTTHNLFESSAESSVQEQVQLANFKLN